MKQILAFALTLSLAFVFLCSDFSYAGEASYGKSYTMENFLSDYQYVVENNTVIKNHMVQQEAGFSEFINDCHG